MATIFEKRVSSGLDDVEQRGSSMAIASSDLELVFDGSTGQQVGLRFTGIDIPAGAIITNAYIQFQTDEVDSVVTSLQIRGLATDDAAPFTTVSNDLSSRATTSSLVSWQPLAWTVIDEAGTAQQTPDLTVVLQEIVDRSGWQAGNDMAFVITGSGTRTSRAFESGADKAPLIHIEYTLPGSNAAPVLDLDASASGSGYMTLFDQSGAVPIADSDVQIIDTDDSAMERLMVTLTNAKAGDQLFVNSGALPAGITIDPSSTAINVVLTGSASIAAYQTAIRQILFDNTNAAPDPTARRVEGVVNDGTANSSPAVATIGVNIGSSTTVLEKRVASGSDDVEQRGSTMAITSSDLELVVDGSKSQKVGVRFTDIDIPAGAIITSAYIQFQTDEVDSVVTSLQIHGLASDDAAPFTTARNDLSSRATTSSLVTWQPPAWTIVNEAGAAQRTPDLAIVLQEVVDRSGWQAGNDVAFVITGSGTRTARAFESNASRAPLLHIEYTLPGSNAAPVLDLDASAGGTGYAGIFAQSGGVPIADSDVQIMDADDPVMERLTVTLTNPKAGDQLIVNSGALPAGITIDPSSTATSVVLTGSASIAAYQAAIRQVLFNNTDAAPDPTARRIEVVVNDGVANSSPAVATIAITNGSSTTIFEKRVVSGSDDVEQRGSSMSITSSDLELVVDGSTAQRVGVRFTDIDIPAGAIITSAYIQFQTDEVDSVATSLQIRGLASDDAAPFTTASNDLSSRPTTSSLVAWQPPAWTTVDEAGAGQRTSDLAVVLQEIVDRSGWQAGNDMAFVITGSGTRTARAFESGSGKAPLLHIEYIAPQTGDIVLTQDSSFRENVAGDLVGTLSIANPEPGETYVFSITDARFEVVGNQLKLKDGIRLDFERTPTANLNIKATDSDGQIVTDMVTTLVGDVSETRFAAFGDYGNNAGSPLVARLVGNLNVDFIITTGDNIYGAEPIDDQVGRYYSDYIGNYTGAYGPGSPANRFFPSLGNHDYSDAAAGEDASAYLNYFTLPGNERYYDFVAGPVHFFAVNSNPEEPNGISSSSVQAQWLQQGLAASVSPYKIVYFHHAAFSSGENHGSTAIMQWPFEEWGATAVLNGHDHTYERILRDADEDGTVLPYFVTGLGGNSRYDFADVVAGSAVRYSDNWGTMLVQASDESITFEFISVTGAGQGTIIDSYRIDLASLSASASEQPTISEDAVQSGSWPTPLTGDLFQHWSAAIQHGELERPVRPAFGSSYRNESAGSFADLFDFDAEFRPAAWHLPYLDPRQDFFI